MDLSKVSEKIDRFLYRRSIQKLSKEDLESAKIWSLEMIRANHPRWTEDEVQKYYESLLNVRVYVVDEWGRRLK
jgi:hypothetical protein